MLCLQLTACICYQHLLAPVSAVRLPTKKNPLIPLLFPSLERKVQQPNNTSSLQTRATYRLLYTLSIPNAGLSLCLPLITMGVAKHVLASWSHDYAMSNAPLLNMYFVVNSHVLISGGPFHVEANQLAKMVPLSGLDVPGVLRWNFAWAASRDNRVSSRRYLCFLILHASSHLLNVLTYSTLPLRHPLNDKSYTSSWTGIIAFRKLGTMDTTAPHTDSLVYHAASYASHQRALRRTTRHEAESAELPFVDH